MVIRPDVIYDAYNSIDKEILKNSRIIHLTPKGEVLTQEKVKNLSKEENIILLCGHYEGIDQRVLDKLEVEEISVGDYILTGGEIPAMIVIDAVSRNVDGVISKDSLEEESFSNSDRNVRIPTIYKTRNIWTNESTRSITISEIIRK